MKTVINIKTGISILLLTAFTVLSSCNRETVIDGGGGDETSGRLERPVLRNNSIYTAWGTKIRGTSVSGFAYFDEADIQQELPRKEDYDYLMKAGINTLQIRIEARFDGQPVGFRAQICDRIVDECERRGLYVIICITAMNGDEENFDAEVRYINEFWEFYAPRYKDRKHVIYEICNEYGRFDENRAGTGFGIMIEGQASAYRTIRRHAPETIVILWSLSDTIWKEDMRERMIALEKRVQGGLKNVAVGIHSYECSQDAIPEFYFQHWGAEGLRSTIYNFTVMGYPVINTEVPARYGTQYIDETLMRVLEEEGTAWISSHYDLLCLPTHWHGGFEAAGIAWTPDYGSWPVPDAHFPFRTSGFGGFTLYGDLAILHRMNFGTRQPLMFVAEAKAEGDGTFEVLLPDGTIIGSCPVSANIDSLKVPILKPVGGVTDIALNFRAVRAEDMLRLSGWKFELPPRSLHQDITRTTYFANYPYRTGPVERALNTDPASNVPLNVRVRHGDILTFDFIPFTNRALKHLHIRARTLAGGRIKVLAGRLSPNPYGWLLELGRVEVNGARGQWAEFVIPVDFDNHRLGSEPWDLNFIFESLSGSGSQELFELSEFVFK